jgi:L-amino acid N-acyltransferase YncA
MEYALEPMKEEHRRPVMDIFNYFIESTFAAYPEAPLSEGVFDQFLAVSRRYPAVVVKDQGKVIVGFAFLQPYHPADSFRKTVVATYFILPEHTRKGVGVKILDAFIREARKKGLENILVNISSLNPGSIEFHRKNGFHKCGAFEDIGTKAGKKFSVIWMIRAI